MKIKAINRMDRIFRIKTEKPSIKGFILKILSIP